MATLEDLPPTGAPTDWVEHGDFRVWAKLRAGIRRDGVLRTLAGLVRWARVRAGLGRAAVREADDGLLVAFDNPSQRPEALLLFGRLVEPEYELVRRVMREGAVVFDVGGGIGTYAMVAARRGARVHVFEPWGPNVATIERNLTANGLRERVTVHAVAASDRCGTAALRVGGNAFETRLGDAERGTGDHAVPTTTIDECCARSGVDAIDLLKVDVEGHEDHVFAGAEAMLARGAVRLIVFEAGRAYAACRARLESHGYVLGFYLDDAHRFVPMGELDHERLATQRPSGFHCNVVAMAPDPAVAPRRELDLDEGAAPRGVAVPER